MHEGVVVGVEQALTGLVALGDAHVVDVEVAGIAHAEDAELGTGGTLGELHVEGLPVGLHLVGVDEFGLLEAAGLFAVVEQGYGTLYHAFVFVAVHVPVGGVFATEPDAERNVSAILGEVELGRDDAGLLAVVEVVVGIDAGEAFGIGHVVLAVPAGLVQAVEVGVAIDVVLVVLHRVGGVAAVGELEAVEVFVADGEVSVGLSHAAAVGPIVVGLGGGHGVPRGTVGFECLALAVDGVEHGGFEVEHGLVGALERLVVALHGTHGVVVGLARGEAVDVELGPIGAEVTAVGFHLAEHRAVGVEVHEVVLGSVHGLPVGIEAGALVVGVGLGEGHGHVGVDDVDFDVVEVYGLLAFGHDVEEGVFAALGELELVGLPLVGDGGADVALEEGPGG